MASPLETFTNWILGRKPAPPTPGTILRGSDRGAREHALYLAEAMARENAGSAAYPPVLSGPRSGYLPGGVVVTATADTNLPGKTRYGPEPNVVFRSYPDLLKQLGSEANAGRHVVVIGSHGSELGLSTAEGRPVAMTAGRIVETGPAPESVDTFSLQRLLSDLPDHYRQAILAACNPQYVASLDERHFLKNNWEAAQYDSRPAHAYGQTREIVTRPEAVEGFTVPGKPTLTRHQPRGAPHAAAIAPGWIGTTAVSPIPRLRSNVDVPILAGHGTLAAPGAVKQLNQTVQYPTADEYERASALMAWARRQLPGWILADQQANVAATLGAPEILPTQALPPPGASLTPSPGARKTRRP